MLQKIQNPRVRWLITTGLFLLCAVVLLVLPYPIGNLVLLVLLAVSLGYWFTDGASRVVAASWGGIRQSVYRHLSFVVAAGVTLAVSCMILSAYFLRPGSIFPHPGYGFIALLIGWVVLIPVVLLAWSADLLPYLPRPAFYWPAPRLTGVHRVLMLSGVVLLALLAEIDGGWFDIPFLQVVDINVQFALLFAGLLLLGLGMQGGRLVWRPEIHWRQALPVIGITLLALVVRFWQLEDSARFLIDEGSFIGAMNIIGVRPDTPLLAPFSSIAAFPYLYPYLISHGVSLFGHTFVGLRATSALVGVAGVLALYWLAKILFDRKTALIAAVLLATFPPHVQFSRIAISEIAGPLFGTLGLAFLGRGVKHNRFGDYGMGGLMLGLTHYFHEGPRLFYLPLAAIWIGGLILIWRPRLPLRRILWGGLILFIVAAPIYYTLIGMDRPLFARMVNNNAGLSASYWQDLFNNDDDALNKHLIYHVIPAFDTYVHRPDSTLFYAGDTGLILPVAFVFFLLGIGYALARLREPGPFLVVLWVLFTSVGNSVLVASANSPRFVLVFPALALAIAVGIRYVLPLLLVRWRRGLSRVMWLVVLALTFIQVVYYFGAHIPAFNIDMRIARSDPDGYDAALRSVNFPDRTGVYIISPVAPSELEVNELMGLLRPEIRIHTVDSKDFSADYLNTSVPCGRDIAFFVMPDDESTIALIDRNFYVRPPQETPYNVTPPSEALMLYYAPYLPGTEQIKGRVCR
ncbi:MAG: glycosyltransferase family 39 protein [Anaerolineaceae bacterium]|nr:glycosyltransferase family 39 protein [Anaerolineaceae bacterium]